MRLEDWLQRHSRLTDSIVQGVHDLGLLEAKSAPRCQANGCVQEAKYVIWMLRQTNERGDLIGKALRRRVCETCLNKLTTA